MDTRSKDSYFELKKLVGELISEPNLLDMKNGYAFVFFTEPDKTELAVQKLSGVCPHVSSIFLFGFLWFFLGDVPRTTSQMPTMQPQP